MINISILSRTSGLLSRPTSHALRSIYFPNSPTCKNIRYIHSDPLNELNIYGNAAIYRRGDPYGSRVYYMLPLKLYEIILKFDAKLKEHPPKLQYLIQEEKIASIYANRNIIFGATCHDTTKKYFETCGLLLDHAKIDAESQAEQPQAMATLYGLCNWVDTMLKDESKSRSKTIENIISDEVVYEAVRSIATCAPKPENSGISEGTYRDAQDSWTNLAREYSDTTDAQEVMLYRSRGAEIVKIEYLADKSEEYLRSAGGTMARLFFF